MRYSYMVIDFADLGGDFAAGLDFIRACGYEGVELNLTPEVLGQLDAIERAVETCGLVVPSLLTGAAYAEGLCLSVADPHRRAGAVARLREYLPIAQRFNALLVVGLLQGLRADEADAEVANERIAAGLREVGLAAQDVGVDLVVEPINHLQVGFNNSVGEVRALIERIGVSAFRPMVDTIHMNIEEKSLTQPIFDCGSARCGTSTCARATAACWAAATSTSRPCSRPWTPLATRVLLRSRSIARLACAKLRPRAWRTCAG